MRAQLGRVFGLALLASVVAASATVALADQAAPSADSTPALVAEGAADFTAELAPETGLGPLFNGRSCVACHSNPAIGGAGGQDLGAVLRVGRLSEGNFDPLVGRGGPVARAHSVRELGFPCSLPVGIPAGANVTSVRAAPQLFGLGLVDLIPDAVILQGAANEPDAVRGRPNVVAGPATRNSVGRFGWKADAPDLQLFVAGALRNEQGVTNPLATDDLLPPLALDAAPCAGQSTAPKDDGKRVRALAAFVGSLPARAPASPSTPAAVAGAQLFVQIGCADCHTPSLDGANGPVPLYSDVLLHDMGPDLNDGVVQAEARGQDWRTTPLWGLGQRSRYLHDGRAQSLSSAIYAHGGQAEAAARAFRALGSDDRDALMAFLQNL